MSPTFDVEGDQLAGVLGTAAGADGQHFALLGLFLGGVGNDQARSSGLLGLAGANDDPVIEGLQTHLERASLARLALSGCECQIAGFPGAGKGEVAPAADSRGKLAGARPCGRGPGPRAPCGRSADAPRPSRGSRCQVVHGGRRGRQWPRPDNGMEHWRRAVRWTGAGVFTMALIGGLVGGLTRRLAECRGRRWRCRRSASERRPVSTATRPRRQTTTTTPAVSSKTAALGTPPCCACRTCRRAGHRGARRLADAGDPVVLEARRVRRHPGTLAASRRRRRSTVRTSRAPTRSTPWRTASRSTPRRPRPKPSTPHWPAARRRGA